MGGEDWPMAGAARRLLMRAAAEEIKRGAHVMTALRRAAFVHVYLCLRGPSESTCEAQIAMSKKDCARRTDANWGNRSAEKEAHNRQCRKWSTWKQSSS